MQFHSGNPGDTKGSNGPKGRHSNSGVRQTTRGVGVVSGLSAQSNFGGDSNRSLGQDTKAGSVNQVPTQPKKKLSTDRGEFTCY